VDGACDLLPEQADGIFALLGGRWMALLTRLERGGWRIPHVPERIDGAIHMFAADVVDGVLAVG